MNSLGHWAGEFCLYTTSKHLPHPYQQSPILVPQNRVGFFPTPHGEHLSPLSSHQLRDGVGFLHLQGYGLSGFHGTMRKATH